MSAKWGELRRRVEKSMRRTLSGLTNNISEEGARDPQVGEHLLARLIAEQTRGHRSPPGRAEAALGLPTLLATSTCLSGPYVRAASSPSGVLTSAGAEGAPS